MEIISIPQLRLGQLQSLAESSLDLTRPVSVLKSSWTSAKSAFDVFLDGMTKESAASDKRTLDKTRDRLVSGFFFAAKAEEYHPYADAGAMGIVDALKKITEEYGFKITRLPYDEETAAIDNMLAKVEEIDLGGMKHLSRWIGLIREANRNFKGASSDYLDQKVESAATDSASIAAPELMNALENLYTMLFAHAKISSDENLIATYQKLSALVEEYR